VQYQFFLQTQTRFCILLIATFFSFGAFAADILNLYPLDFAEKILHTDAWKKSFENSGSEEYEDLAQFIKNLPHKKYNAENLAREILINPNTYKFKFQFLKFLAENSKERNKYPFLSQALHGVWSQIPEVYLDALILMIEGSAVKASYGPIIENLKQLKKNNHFQFVDLNESVRQNLAGLTNKLHFSSRANTLTKDENGKYVVNGLYNSGARVFALDLSLSRDENLVTFAHEIVHIADPEQIKNQAQLQVHFSRLAEKIKVLFPNGQVEDFLRGLIQNTFMEQGRFDIAAVELKKVDIGSEPIKEISDDIKLSGYDYLLDDADFKGFIRNLIAISVENEYKAYVLSYSLYAALKDENSQLIPPSEKRDQFIKNHFDHPSKLQEILKDEANPFRKSDILFKLMPQLSQMTSEQKKSDEIKKLVDLVNIFKKMVQTLYFEESRQMIERTTKEFEPLYKFLSRTNFSKAKSEADEDFLASNPFLRAGAYRNSITNPYLLAEAELGTTAITLFRKNVAGLRYSLESMHDALLTMMSGILPINNLNFGELKLTGLMSVNDIALKALPPTCTPADMSDLQSSDPDAIELFNRFIYNKENSNKSPYLGYDDARLQIYSMQLLKVVLWLRKEFPVTRENFDTLTMFQNKLMMGKYETDQISSERAEKLTDKIKGYLTVIKPTQEELRNIEYLMITLENVHSAARRLKLFSLDEEFVRRMATAKRYFRKLGVATDNMPEQNLNAIDVNVQNSVNQLLTEIANSNFAKACAFSDDFKFNKIPIEFNFGKNRKMKNLTLFCTKRQLYVLRLPCGWSSGSTTSTIDPNGVVTQIFLGGRKLIMAPLLDLREKK
jgi:hypothetical protein